jgi:lipid-binding SYLF domain-containing protein
MIALTPTGAWSAPCFVTLKRFQIGAVAGMETAHMLMASLTRVGVEELAAGGSHFTLGTDITFQVWPFSTSGSGPDVYASLDVGSDWVIAAVGQGLLFDFSLSGSSLSVDVEKNKKVYGDDMGGNTADILHGRVPNSAIMVPLYRKIKEISSRALS